VACMGEERNVYRVLVGKPEGKRPLEKPSRRLEDGIRWHYSSSVSIHLSARCIASRPRTAPSTPPQCYVVLIPFSHEMKRNLIFAGASRR
jgi:hypothetical protein